MSSKSCRQVPISSDINKDLTCRNLKCFVHCPLVINAQSKFIRYCLTYKISFYRLYLGN